MSAPPYMKLYVADYLGDTHHLGALEHGAYLLLLMGMWRAGGTLPSADGNLARLARCTPDQWAEIKATILAYFKVSRGKLTHKRLAEEMAKYDVVSRRRSEAGKRGVTKKASDHNDMAQAIAEQLPLKPEPEPEPKKETEDKSSVLAMRPKAKASKRAPPDWEPSSEDRAKALSFGMTNVLVDWELAKLRDFEFKTPRSDWGGVFRNWMRSASERLPTSPQAMRPAHERPSSQSAKFDRHQANLERANAGAESAARYRAVKSQSCF